jgi:hypothetical protein
MPRTKTAPAPAATTESTTPTAETLTATEQIHERARTISTRLQAHITDLASNIADASRELEEIDAARQAREQRLTDLRGIVSNLAAAHTQSIHYAGLASGTLNEASSIRLASDSQRELETAQRELLAAEQLAEQTERATGERQASLQKDLDAWQAEQRVVSQELQEAESMTARAHADLGQEKYAQLTRGYEDCARQVEQVRAQLVAAQIKQIDYYDSAIEQLTDWPALQRQVRDLETHDDATTRTLEASIFFLETLANDLQAICAAPLPSLKVNSPLYSGYRELWQEVLAIHTEVVEILRGGNNPTMLGSRLERLRQFLSEYRTYIQGNI